ncbi:MAG: hypothetical protein M3Z23_11625, partial [Acidobacteriota bacterium]|nr:hypothetical protein [Acidobacteriota bacterium]
MDTRFDAMDTRFDAMDTRFDAMDTRFDAMERQFKEALEATETKLLTEFWKWARTLDAKLRRMEASDAATAERLTILEERVFTLERKVEGSKE